MSVIRNMNDFPLRFAEFLILFRNTDVYWFEKNIQKKVFDVKLHSEFNAVIRKTILLTL